MTDRRSPSDKPLDGERRFDPLPELMPRRVRDVLLVSSLYDSFILAEDGRLAETVLADFLELNLRHAPSLARVSTGAAALEAIAERPRFNVVLSSLHVGDMHVVELARTLREHGHDIPVVLLAYDNRELTDFGTRHDLSGLAGTFLWQGDVRILVAIVKLLEDRWNLEHDSGEVGVPLMLVVEDNVRFYSSFLPVIYGELVKHASQLVPDGVNHAHKVMRVRARPKIALCTTYEQAWELFVRYRERVLGVLSDIEFPRHGVKDREAGVTLAREIRRLEPDVPLMLQSSLPENERLANDAGAAFLLKGSPLLLKQLGRFLVDGFGFGDFVFRLQDGTEVDRASNLRTLAQKIRTVPDGCLTYHGSRNHFSRWLRLRTEFALADRLRTEQVTDFPTTAALREFLASAIERYRAERNRGVVADFVSDAYDFTTPFARIGGGSLGGKARGLAFANYLLDRRGTVHRFEGIEVAVPPAVVLATDVYDRFLDDNDLRDFAINSDDATAIAKRFREAPFPDGVRSDLRAFVATHDAPIAVRSSGLLEDSAYQPFAGVYETFMLPNNEPHPELRLALLEAAVKQVFASTFSHGAKSYLDATPYRLEEEKMAVIVQGLVGRTHGTHFYPDFAGVCRSYDYYPTPPAESADGIAVVALGFGRTVVEGGRGLRFCPAFPKHSQQFGTEELLATTQRTFWALDIAAGGGPRAPGARMVELGVDVAERHGTLAPLASTYSAENDAIYDGTSRAGTRLVTFAPILRHDRMPLAEILRHLLEIGEKAAAAPVEIEFAVNLGSRDRPTRFGFLQLRPVAPTRETSEVDPCTVDEAEIVCRSDAVLGHGSIDDVRDLIVVDYDRFDRSKGRETAIEIARLNARLMRDGSPYILIGVGRWGSADPWLGIPVTWDQIAGCRAIVECDFRDIRVDPSQGTHFFQNLTSCNVGYFTVDPTRERGFVDWDWLRAREAAHESDLVRHLRFDTPLHVVMNGKTRQGVIRKPAC